MPRSSRPVRGAWRPTREQRLVALGKRIPDVVAPHLDILFCGINPGLYSAAVRHHFAGPGNLFWPTLFAAGFTPRLLSAFEEAELLPLGLGITNLVARSTASADEIARDELHQGAKTLQRKVRRLQPRYLVVLGLLAFRTSFNTPKAAIGLQPLTIGTTQVWLLPNPSGLNAFYQSALLTRIFAELRTAVCFT